MKNSNLERLWQGVRSFWSFTTSAPYMPQPLRILSRVGFAALIVLLMMNIVVHQADIDLAKKPGHAHYLPELGNVLCSPFLVWGFNIVLLIVIVSSTWEMVGKDILRYVSERESFMEIHGRDEFSVAAFKKTAAHDGLVFSVPVISAAIAALFFLMLCLPMPELLLVVMLMLSFVLAPSFIGFVIALYCCDKWAQHAQKKGKPSTLSDEFENLPGPVKECQRARALALGQDPDSPEMMKAAIREHRSALSRAEKDAEHLDQVSLPAHGAAPKRRL